MKLVREVRFSVGGQGAPGAVTNSYAGWPAAARIQPYLVLRLVLEGEPDPVTGYICNINVLDRPVRERTVPRINGLLAGNSARADMVARVSAEHVLTAIALELQASVSDGTSAGEGTGGTTRSAGEGTGGTARLASLQLCLTPFLTYELRPGEPNMIYLTQTFEFAAAHRLHCPSLTDRENRETFGKCNNPNGHGHNYVLEVTVAGEPDRTTGVVLPLERLEATVKERVIDRFDHKHLNADCPDFADLNPTVEHIARIIWSRLEGQLAPARLARVRVWETSKTYAEYEGTRPSAAE